jgi:hypothetical protein
MANKLPVVADATGLPIALDDLVGDAGMGLSNVRADDQAIPFLQLLQQLSPQCQKRGAAYVEGAEPGMIYNSVSGQVAEELVVVPVAYLREIVEWRPREAGGGFVAKHPVDSPIVNSATKNDRGQDILPNGNLLANTAYHYVLVVKDDGTWEQAVVSMASTQLKKSRRWNSMMTSIKLRRKDGTPFTPPSFLFRYRLSTEMETRDGNSWFGWSIANIGQIQDSVLYGVAREYAVAVGEGVVRAVDPHDAAEVETKATPF